MKTIQNNSSFCQNGTLHNMGRRPNLRFLNSSQWNGMSFQNSLPNQPFDYLGILSKTFFGRVRDASPSEPLSIVSRVAEDFASPPASGLRATWLGHSSSLIEIDGKRILLDPVLSERASPFSCVGAKRFHEAPLPLEELPEIDAILISHDHYDHLDRDTVVHLAQRPIRWIVPLGVGSHLTFWGVPEENIRELDWWQQQRVGNVTVTSLPARHDSGRSVFFTDRRATLWCGWAIQSADNSVYFSGDSGMQGGFIEIGNRLGPFDLTLIEIGAYDALWPDQHLGPEQAVQAHQMVKGKLMLPVHWATFELAPHSWTEPIERFLVAAREAEIEFALPRPGQSLVKGQPQPTERWWPELPWRDATAAPIRSSFSEYFVQSPARVLQGA